MTINFLLWTGKNADHIVRFINDALIKEDPLFMNSQGIYSINSEKKLTVEFINKNSSYNRSYDFVIGDYVTAVINGPKDVTITSTSSDNLEKI